MKKILISFSLLFFLSLIFFSNFEFIKNTNTVQKIRKTLAYNLPTNVSTFFRIITNIDGHLFEHYNNDYKVKFLPQTQFVEDVGLKKIKLNFLTKDPLYYKYSFDLIDDHLIIATHNGKLYIKNIKDILEKNQDQINFKNLKTNLNNLILPEDLMSSGVSDILVNDNKIYILAHENINNCKKIYLYGGDFNLNSIYFEEIFTTKQIVPCLKEGVTAGRVQVMETNDEKSFLITFSNKGMSGDPYKKMSEFENSKITDFGNIISINKKNKNFKVYASGFRNILGLYADKKFVISTDNGAKGGDEINKVIENAHYGFPYASYGERYTPSIYPDKVTYKKEHEKYGFEEPIYSYIYALGIAEIIKIDNLFSKFWQDNFLVSSLNAKTIFRIKFDSEFKKIIYSEQIFIGERVRDLKYDSKNKRVFLALTSSGSLGILSNKKGNKF